MLKYTWFLIQILEIATRRFFREQYTYKASALAFTTLLAIVPLLAVIVFFLSWFPSFSDLILLGKNYIISNFVPSTTTNIEYYFLKFMHQTSHLPTVSVIFLFITALLMINTMEDALNDIWNTKGRTKHYFSVILYCSVILFVPLIIGLSVFFSSYFFSLPFLAPGTKLFGIVTLLLPCFPIFINTLIFTMLYIIVPNTPVKISDGLFGGFLAAIMLEAARVSFAYYLQLFPSYSTIYGAFAIIPIFLVWLYIFWFIILFAALAAYAKSKYHIKNVTTSSLNKTDDS